MSATLIVSLYWPLFYEGKEILGLRSDVIKCLALIGGIFVMAGVFYLMGYWPGLKYIKKEDRKKGKGFLLDDTPPKGVLNAEKIDKLAEKYGRKRALEIAKEKGLI